MQKCDAENNDYWGILEENKPCDDNPCYTHYQCTAAGVCNWPAEYELTSGKTPACYGEFTCVEGECVPETSCTSSSHDSGCSYATD